jgi:hypothetical protein
MVLRRSAVSIGIFPLSLAHVLEIRQKITPPGTRSLSHSLRSTLDSLAGGEYLVAPCGMVCLVPSNYGTCSSNDTLCLCSTPSVVQAVGACIFEACTVQDDRDATIAYMLGVCQSFVCRLPGPVHASCLHYMSMFRVSPSQYHPPSYP